MRWASVLLAAVAPQALGAPAPNVLETPAPHVVARNRHGVLDFVRLFGSEVNPGADGPEGAWAKIIASSCKGSEPTIGAFLGDGGGIALRPGPFQSGAKPMAWGTFRDTQDELGWGGLVMHVSEDKGVDDGVKMYAAGAVEGFLTAERIREFYHNSRGLLEMSEANVRRLPALQLALGETIAGLAAGAEANSSSPDGVQARVVLLQSWGIRDGYAAAVGRSVSLVQAGVSTRTAQPPGPRAEAAAPATPPPQAPAAVHSISLVDVFILNSDGVIDELLTAYGGEAQEDEQDGEDTVEDALVQARGVPRLRRRLVQQRKRQTRKLRRRKPHQLGHCTGIVRLAENNNELYFGHTTWEPFSEMTRIWKLYDFPLQGVATRKISFSSYPGCVSSTDDFYLMDSGLAVMETTLSIARHQHYKPTLDVPDFVRIMAANRLSSSGQAWAETMTGTATGTYSSQWMILDYNRFHKGEGLDAGALTVLEQAPGVSHTQDMTPWLKEKGYWASYDKAFFGDVRAVADDAQEERDAEGPEVEEAPRAQIIRRTIGRVGSLGSMREEMTRNLGKNEPVDQKSFEVPRYAISARDDMLDNEKINPEGSPEGGVDAKVTSSCLFRSLAAHAISSPSHSVLPPFRWTKDGNDVWPGYPHEGLKDVADFEWVRVSPASALDDERGPDGGNLLRSLSDDVDCA